MKLPKLSPATNRKVSLDYLNSYWSIQSSNKFIVPSFWGPTNSCDACRESCRRDGVPPSSCNCAGCELR